MVVTILLSHHKFTPPIAKKLKMRHQDSNWIVRVKRLWSNAAYIKKQNTTGKKKAKREAEKLSNKSSKGENSWERGDRPRGRSVIPAQEHRRYCSRSCRRGAVQEHNRRRVKRSSAISLSKRILKKSWTHTNKIKQILQQKQWNFEKPKKASLFVCKNM